MRIVYMAPKARSFVFTLNNYTDDEFMLIKELKYKYIVIGDEIGENGTPHLQGYVNFSSPISFNTIKKAMPRAHIETAKGNARQNYERFETFPWATLLRITDIYPNQVETKNGNRQLTAKRIIITAPVHPLEMFEGRVHEKLDQFIRRITKIKMFS